MILLLLFKSATFSLRLWLRTIYKLNFSCASILLCISICKLCSYCLLNSFRNNVQIKSDVSNAYKIISNTYDFDKINI